MEFAAGLEVGRGHYMLIAAVVEGKEVAVDAEVVLGLQHPPCNKAQECQQDV